jgi:hypothetical protein
MQEISIQGIYDEKGEIAYYSIFVNDSDDDLIIEIPSGSKIDISHDCINITLHNRR